MHGQVASINGCKPHSGFLCKNFMWKTAKEDKNTSLWKFKQTTYPITKTWNVHHEMFFFGKVPQNILDCKIGPKKLKQLPISLVNFSNRHSFPSFSDEGEKNVKRLISTT